MQRSAWILPALGLGFGLGGFFDGILLHQILQWHHLLSLVPGIDGLRMQILWDGFFHALMYVFVALGLIGLWRAHRRGSQVAGQQLYGALLMGSGTWHVIDAILSHWLLGIHRIKVDAANPLAWDLGWVILFGLVPCAFGWNLLRRGGGGSGPGRPTGRPSIAALTILSLGAGLWAMQPPVASPYTTVVFGADRSPAQVFAALEEAEARLVWTDAEMGVVVVDAPAERRWSFYRNGGMWVSGAGLPAGCLDWTTL